MSDVFESYEKYVAKDMKQVPASVPDEEQLFKDEDDVQVEDENEEKNLTAPTPEIDYEKLAELVAAKLKGGE